MNYYTQNIFPKWMNASLSKPQVTNLRRNVLRAVQGKILEIGFGSGLNLSCYPKTVDRITAVDSSPDMYALSWLTIRDTGVSVDLYEAPSEQLPFQDASFDTVVSTWTLCSVSDPLRSLEQIHRVLKPGGMFIFLEHGLSCDTGVRFSQSLLNPFYKVLAAGCNLNRDISGLISAAGLRIVELNQFQLTGTPKHEGCLYQGQAIRD